MLRFLVKKSFLILTLFGFNQFFVQAQNPQTPQNSSIDNDETIPVLTYDYLITGLDDIEVSGEFKDRSRLEILKERPLYSNFSLSRRAKEDQDTLQKLLYSFGYYDATLDVLISDTDQKKPLRHIEFKVKAGTRYALKDVKFVFVPKAGGPEPCQKNLHELKLYRGEFFTAEKVLASFENFKDHLGTCGYPFAKIIKHEVLLSKMDKNATLVLTLDPGPYVTFGSIHIKSSGVVSEGYVRNRAPFKQGEAYDQRKIDDYRDTLSSSRLFEKISIPHTQEMVQDNHELPVNVDLEDGKPRTLSAGVSFGTSEGVGAKTSWTHRNFVGEADKLVVSGEISQVLATASLDHYLPDFLKKNQTLGTALNYEEENTKSYDSRGYGMSLILDNEFRRKWSYFYGLSVETTRISQRGEIIHVDALGVPLGFKIDTRNDELDPSSGGKFLITLTPEYGHLGNVKFITRSQIFASYHIAMDEYHRHVLSIWSRLGTLFGGTVEDMPGDRRFYAGGGGSVRGYGYQLAGPLGGDGKPLGGKSLWEFGIEPRVRFGDDWGAVAFLEGAMVSQKSHPSSDHKLLLGAGIGLRYYTNFGPIRADIAIPFQKRRQEGGKIVDRPFQFYISIGQSF